MLKKTLKNNAQSAKNQAVDRKFKKIPIFIYFATIILVSMTIFAVLPQFRIQQVEFQDFFLVSQEEVYEASGIKKNQFFLKGIGGTLAEYLEGRYIKAEKNVKNDFPEIDTVKIYFQFPSKVIFEVKEKIEIGWIKIQDGFCTVDGEGKVISILKEQPEALPIISGLTVLNATIGKKIEVVQEDYLANAMYVMSSLIEADVDVEGEKLLTMIKKIEPTINNDIYLSLANSQKSFTIICDKSHDLTDDFIWLKKVMNSDVFGSETSGIIDLRGKNRLFRKSRPGADSENTIKQEETGEKSPDQTINNLESGQNAEDIQAEDVEDLQNMIEEPLNLEQEPQDATDDLTEQDWQFMQGIEENP